MHEHNKPAQAENSTIVAHIILIVAAAGALIALYLLTQNITISMAGVVVIVLAHVVAVVVILLAGRSALRTLIDKFHGASQPYETTHGHSHEEGAAGHVIRWAWFYDVFVSILTLGQQKKSLHRTLEKIHIQPGDAVLDVGCGTGTLALLANRKYPSASVQGIDAGKEMIGRAQQKAARQGTDIDFRLGLAQELPFPGESFDVVTNSLMMHHLPDDLKAQAAVEMYRVLKPGGRLLIVEFDPPTNWLPRTILSLLVGQMTDIENEYLTPLLAEAGFSQVTLDPSSTKLTITVTGQKPGG